MSRGREPDAPRSRWVSIVFALTVGALAAQLATHLLAPGALQIFNFAIYIGFALSVAVAYRRFVRRALIERRRARARRATPTPRKDEARP